MHVTLYYCLLYFTLISFIYFKFQIYHYYPTSDNTSIDRDSIPISLLPYIVEPCIICDGEGSFDYVKSIDENVYSWSDECSKNINDIKNDEIYEMLMVDECNLLMERCVVCHDKTTNISTGINDTINRN
jgi:hypothetical protein